MEHFVAARDYAALARHCEDAELKVWFIVLLLGCGNFRKHVG